MLEVMWYLLFIVAIILIVFIIIFEYDEYPFYWGMMFSILDTIIWFLLAASVFETEITWVLQNATSGNIESGVSIVTSKVSPELSYFCIMMGVIMMVYSAYYVFTSFKTLYDEKGRI